MFFAKGEINMNNIYKVIWSKAKNCYVVASEIARSHTKSATGSGKIGGVTRRSLLASLMALSLLCGGWGAASASLEVVDQSGTAGTVTIYTKDEVDKALEAKGAATDVASNTANIAANKDNINKLDTKKLDKDLANSTFATKDALNDLEDAVNNKVDESVVETALDGKADKADTLAGYGIKDAYTKGDVDNKLNEKADAANVFTKDQTYTRDQVNTKLADYAKTTDVNTALAGKANVGDSYTKAEADGQITTAKNELGDKITANTTKIDANKTAIDDLKTKAATTENTLTNLSGRMAAAESDIDGLQADMATAKSDIGTLKADVSTAKSDINSLKMKDTELTGKIEAEIANRITSDTALDNKINAEIANRITSDTALDNKIDTEIQDRKDAIKATNDRTGGIARNTEGTQTTIEGIVKVDNQGNVKDVKGLSAETITTTGDAAIGGTLGVTGATTLNGALTANGEAKFKEKVTVEKDLAVNGKLNVGEIYLENNKLEATGKKHDSATSITADGISNLSKVTEHGNTTESQFTHNEKGTFNHAKDGTTTDWKESTSKVTASGVSNKMTDSADNEHTYSQTATETTDRLVNGDKSNFEKKTAEGNTISIKDKDAAGNPKSLTNKQTVDGEKTSVTNNESSSTINQGADQIRHNVTSADGKKSSIEVKADGITNTSKDGTITNDAKDIVNNATGDMTNNVGGKLTTTVTGQATENFNGGLDTNVTGKENHTVTGDQNIHVTENQTNTIDGNQENTIGGDQTTTVKGNVKEDYKKDLTTTVGGNELHEVTGTKTENVTGKVTENYGNGQETNVTGNQDIHVTGKQTNKIDGDQENTIGGNQTTTVTGDISNKAKNITNEASNSITDKVGDHTRVLDSDGITDTVGGSTFKQRIDKIMMESKNVSIKAEETLTNEAKVITNKASEVINNEAVKINNTATGIITSKASEIKNQADKLISNKVGENTWENMENGKITTSIKDGAKQNLTQSDAAGTTQSTVDGGKSTVTIQNADGLTDAVTDGRNTSVQNQTASQIAAAVKDGAGNENASVANATTSANTITNGTKANTVISTADGTSFINSEAAAPVTGASGAGTHLNTTIKGNTITTGKVTMDYAEVMKDLGVRGNANITGKTTTGSLEVKGESKLTGDVTMESNATVKKDLTVEGNTNLKNTKVDGTLDVTQKANFGDSVSIAKDLSVGGNATIKGDVTASSYKVGDKTYISAAGINANDQKITNVADGSISEGSKDAVNGGQLYTVKNDFEGKVNKVGANAAAMANLHPMEFDPDSKWNIAAAIGNYGSETAAALGAFYRPNDDVMVNLSTAFGTGENMVGGGVSVRLGKGGNKLSREETNALKAQVADLSARMDALLSVLNPNMSKDFPDVPENHWAYEAVSRLAGNDIVQGYPDGEFHGERTMTRYEMAEIIYNALSRGAEAEKELVEEFKPELQAMAASEKATAEKAEG